MSAGRGPTSGDAPKTTVLAIVADPATRALLPRVLGDERLLLASTLPEGLALAVKERPDVAFVDITIAGGAGLAMIHHIKAVAPDASVFALATAATLEAGANAVALGGAGLLMLPLGGDEVLNAIAGVKIRRGEHAMRAELEVAASQNARAAGWIARVAELADAPDRTTAARELAEVLAEATGATGSAIYLLASPDRASELARVVATSGLERGPAFGTEMDVLTYARRERLLVVPLALRKLTAGHVLLQLATPAGGPASGRARLSATASPAFDGLLRLLAAQATTAFAMLAERDRASGGGAIKDPTSSAYSFAYYADVAGREIDKARRHGRRFAIATVLLEGAAEASRELGMTPAEVADYLLRTVRDADVLARVDEHEFHLLLAETDGLGAHACRRRILSRVGSGDERRARFVPRALLVGIATYPHDGQELSQLLRMARRRTEASERSIVHRLSPALTGLGDILAALEQLAEEQPAATTDLAATRPIEAPLAHASALASAVVGDALRGGKALVVVAQHGDHGLGAAVRAAVGPSRDNVTVHAVDARTLPDGDDLEVLSVIAEHGTYAFIGRSSGGVVRGVHAACPLLADVLAERLGRAAGLRVFA